MKVRFSKTKVTEKRFQEDNTNQNAVGLMQTSDETSACDRH